MIAGVIGYFILVLSSFKTIFMLTSIAGSSVLSNLAFGQGSGPIFLDNLMCAGEESRLVDCSHAGFEENNCSHSQDAGLSCQPGTLYYLLVESGCGLSVWTNSVGISLRLHEIVIFPPPPERKSLDIIMTPHIPLM